jgi:asparagine synthase (glutamine-hydrolysing)
VPLYYVAKLLRDSGTIVVQVGEGADEIFCGYPGYMEFLRSYRRDYSPYMKLPGAMRRAAHGVWRGLGLDGRGPDIVGEALRWARKIKSCSGAVRSCTRLA